MARRCCPLIHPHKLVADRDLSQTPGAGCSIASATRGDATGGCTVWCVAKNRPGYADADSQWGTTVGAGCR